MIVTQDCHAATGQSKTPVNGGNNPSTPTDFLPKHVPLSGPCPLRNSSSPKRVRFNTERNQFFRDEMRISAHDCRETWYSKLEYSEIYSALQKAVLNEAKKARRYKNNNGCDGTASQENSFPTILRTLMEFTSNIKIVLDDVSIAVTPEVEQKLGLLYKKKKKQQDRKGKDENAFDLIGLESYVQKKLRNEAKE